MPDSDDPVFQGILLEATGDLAQEKLHAAEEHPTEEELLSYQERRMDAEEAMALRQHLAVCRSCADVVLELAAWDDEVPEDAEGFPTPLSMPARRRALDERLAKEAASSGGASSLARLPLSLAAAWAAAALALGLILGNLDPCGWFSATTDSPPASSHPYFADLIPDDSTPIRAAGQKAIRVPEATNLLVLRLNLGEPELSREYRAEILSSSDEIVWTQRDLAPQPTGAFVVLVPLEDIAPGGYRLILFGQDPQVETKLAVYSFELSLSPSY